MICSLQECFSRPVKKAIDGAAGDQGGQLAAAQPEGLPNRAHAQHNVQLGSHTLHKRPPQGQGLVWNALCHEAAACVFKKLVLVIVNYEACSKNGTL